MVFKSNNSPNSNFVHGKIGHSLRSEYHAQKKSVLNKTRNSTINYDEVSNLIHIWIKGEIYKRI